MPPAENLFADQEREDFAPHVLSEAESAAKLAHAYSVLNHITSTLKDRERRVLSALTEKFGGTLHQTGRASVVELAQLTGLADSNVRLAIGDLVRRNLLARRAGTTRTPAAFALTFTRILLQRIPPTPGGIEWIPPTPGGIEANEGRRIPPTPGGIEANKGRRIPPTPGGIEWIPPTPGGIEANEGRRIPPTPGGIECPPNMEHARLPARRSIDTTNTEKVKNVDRTRARESVEILKPEDFVQLSPMERILTAKPSHFGRADLKAVWQEMYGFHAKMAQLNGKPKPRPPDDDMCAQMLAVAPLDGVRRFFADRRCERPAKVADVESYAYYVSVAAEKIHGITSGQLRAARHALRVEPKPHKALIGEQESLLAPPIGENTEIPQSVSEISDPDFSSELLAEVAARRAKRSKF